MLNHVQPALREGFAMIGDEANRRAENMQNIALADLQLQRDALQKNLVVMHRTMLVAFFAVLVSILLGIYAIKSKQTIDIQPRIEVHLDEQKTIRASN